MNKNMRKMLGLAASACLAGGVVACGGDDGESSASSGSGSGGGNLSGSINIDGSSTVFPFIQAAAELFNQDNPDVQITVGQSGTSGGFEKFCNGETDISNASRPIKDDEEVPVCKENGVAYKEVQVANDGIAVVTTKGAGVDCLTTDELKEIWNKGSKVDEYDLFGPGTDSGTFDFFTDVINGEEGVTRDDYEASEDDNQLVQGVAGSDKGMGYFGFSYYEANTDKLDVVKVDAGDGCVEPSAATIQDGSYKPLSRPLFMYPSDKAVQKPEVKAFAEFILENQAKIAEAAKIVPMTDEQAQKSTETLGAS